MFGAKEIASVAAVHKEATASWFFRQRFRFYVLVLTTACLTSILANMLSVNTTINCMDPSRNSSHRNQPVHSYTDDEKTALEWTVSIASMVATFPFSWICAKYGARYPFFVSGLTSAISTALIPLATSLGFAWFVFVRVFQGLAYACDFAVIGVLCSRWASLKENAKFLALMTCFSPIANAVAQSFSGVICDSSLGWPWAHYFFGMAGVVLFFAWFWLYSDDPRCNQFVSNHELATIHHEKSEAHKNLSRYVPYLAIFKSKVVWGVWLAAFADLYSGYFLFIFAPTYTIKVLKFSATHSGIVGAIGSLSHIPVKLVCGYVSDTYSCIAERYKMWIFNSVALLIPAAIFIWLCFVDNATTTVILFGSVHAALGFNCGGFYKCGALVSRQYAEFVIACTQFIKCAVFFVAPALVGIFVRDETVAGQWHAVFFITAATLVVANVVFCFVATDEPAAFTKLEGTPVIADTETAIMLG
ncbi:major facilitator superfamily transporter [Aphelenchoides avenae]|nr:major facilitator superfamily transporter [Aphelenchus avenae]